MSLSDNKPDYLRRLGVEHYQGWAWVHWTMSIKGRKKGWLDASMHAAVREIILHTCVRYRLLCPAYCLMPDHGHFLLMGIAESSDQKLAVQFLRRAWNARLRELGVELQKQGFDHVLEESERNPDSFEDTCLYVFRNPERAKLVSEWREWKLSGSLAPGYPDLDPREDSWAKRFWTIHNKEQGRFSSQDSSRKDGDL